MVCSLVVPGWAWEVDVRFATSGGEVCGECGGGAEVMGGAIVCGSRDGDL